MTQSRIRDFKMLRSDTDNVSFCDFFFLDNLDDTQVRLKNFFRKIKF